ncbi:hypothetical protein D9613_004017 [Agrocybe pediades]|uniref:Uncharacterized protein n=1 Tax=Agrocybe pediades TaxID=84607 RepID=A0A8H4VL14_9AGAR|nr:hypothetical protein D9613_004017 [Agrocybe pediades]
MIIDSKVILDPPPYLRSPSSAPGSPFPNGSRPPATLSSLPAHILLQIIHHTFPPLPSANSPSGSSIYTPAPPMFSQIEYQLSQPSIPERQRKTLLWLSTHLRLVSRSLYTACMHVLRSTYLPAYQAMVKPPYTSDPFPMGLPITSVSSTSEGSRAMSGARGGAVGPPAYSPTIASPLSPSSASSIRSGASRNHHHHHSEPHSPLITPHRETPILDRFILLKVRQDVFLDDTELHTDRADAFRDIFDVAQPKSRLEDLVRVFGIRAGVVSVPGWMNAKEVGEEYVDGPDADVEAAYEDVDFVRPAPTTTNWAKGTVNFGGDSPGSSRNSSSSDLPLRSPQSAARRTSFASTAAASSPASTAASSSANAADSESSSSGHSISEKGKGKEKEKSTPLRSLFFRSSLFGIGKHKKSASLPSPTPLSPSIQSYSPTPSLTSLDRAQLHIRTQTQAPAQREKEITPLPFSSLSISFSPRRVGLVYNRTKTIVEVPRTRGPNGQMESLEFLARAVVRELKETLEGGLR